jgi:hypothetical protein
MEKNVAVALLLVALKYLAVAEIQLANHLEQRLISNRPRPLNPWNSLFYCVSVGTCDPPSAGADELAIVFAAIAFTKHPSISVLVVVAGSR